MASYCTQPIVDASKSSPGAGGSAVRQKGEEIRECFEHHATRDGSSFLFDEIFRVNLLKTKSSD
jgi:hypothetical protein